jgi:poly(3-hydroxybutyrate) depolymerase
MLSGAEEGRLASEWGAPSSHVGPGVHALGIASPRDALLYVPRGYRDDQPVPLAVMLHGSGGTAEHGLAILRTHSDDANFAILAPASREHTWDAILGGYGPDVDFIDAAIDATFDCCGIDPAHIAIGGFSDGASYALSLGLTNGELFSHVIALSPGFMAPTGQCGAPSVYLSHGTQDTVLPIDRCSRPLVPALEEAGYELRYHEFDGGHVLPEEVRREAVEWFVGRG